MISTFRSVIYTMGAIGRRFRSNTRGNVAILFGFAGVSIAIGVGAGIDLSGAYAARQKLSEAATLTCQYSARTSVVNVAANPGNTFQTYVTTVNTFATNALNAQHLVASNVTPVGSYFTSTSGTSGPTNSVTDMSMTYPTSFLKIMHVTSIPVHARIGCLTPTAVTSTTTPGTILLQAGFETSCSSYCFTQPSGVGGALLNPTTTFGTSPTYVDPGGFSFYVIGYCLEIDNVGVISQSDPEKTHSAELDCDNANHTAGNSSLSTRVFLTNGTYEIRYFYRSRVDVAAFDPFYICGWTNNDPLMTDDLSWVNQTNFPNSGTTSAMRTNQMNVYFDATTSTDYPPLHYTNYGTATQKLAGSNLIDACVYAPRWVERSVTVSVTTPGYFWLSFAADGQNDSYGAQLDNIRLCVVTCPTTQQDNYPDTQPWTSPSEPTQNTTIASSSELGAINWNWNQNPNSTNYQTPMCTSSSFSSCTNVLRTADTGANVLLDPGFYKLTYQYTSPVTFSNPPALSTTTGCDATPSQTDITNYQTRSGTATNPIVATSKKNSTANQYTSYADVAMTGAFLSFPGQSLTAVASATTSTTSPLIDLCYYTATYARTHDVYFKVTKPGFYNLTYYALGTLTSSLGTSNTKYLGGAINISNLALVGAASPFTMSLSSNCSTVPVPDPQVGSPQTPSSGGFTFTATDPFLQGASATACP